MRAGGYGGKTDRICPIDDRERGQAESREGTTGSVGKLAPKFSLTFK